MTDEELVKLLIDNTNDLKTQKLLANLGYYPEYFMYSDSRRTLTMKVTDIFTFKIV